MTYIIYICNIIYILHYIEYINKYIHGHVYARVCICLHISTHMCSMFICIGIQVYIFVCVYKSPLCAYIFIFAYI